MPAKKPEQDRTKKPPPGTPEQHLMKKPPADKSEKDRTKILIVEDEGDMSLLLELLLDNEKMVVDHVHNLCDARDFVEKEQPALILLDNRLPDGLGIDFIGYLKVRYPRIKIIMMSGVDAEAEDAALATGADRFLCKPFTKMQLHDSIGKVLN